MKLKQYFIDIILIVGIFLSSIGIHQAFIAKEVSKLVFQAAHMHNWFWADGWHKLFVEEVKNELKNKESSSISVLLKSFESSKKMTECFSSLRKAREKKYEPQVMKDLVSIFKITSKQAKHVIWITKKYSSLFPEFELMMRNTDMGTQYSSEAIRLIKRNNFKNDIAEFIEMYNRMRVEEGTYSERSFVISQKANLLQLSFLSSLLIFIGLFFTKLMHNRHKKSQNYISNIINSMPSVLVAVDENAKVKQWNNKASKITGIASENAKGKHLIDLLPRIAPEIGKIKESIKTKQIRSDIKKQSIIGGKLHFEDITIYPLVTNGISGAVIRIDDITKDRKIEERLRQSEKMEAIGLLAGGIAHDFNNILGGIMGYAEMTYDDIPDGDPLKTNMKQILSAADRAKDLVNQILAFSRQSEEANIPLYIYPIVKEVLQLLRASLPSSIEIKQELKKDTKPVRADAIKIHEIIMNLCTNAAQAIGEKGILEVACYEEEYRTDFNGIIGTSSKGNYSVIIIKDNGCGMSEETLSHIFEPFFTTKGIGEGTGMGLAVLFGIIKRYKGNIKIESKEGVGTTFYVYLPKTEEKLRENTKQNSEIEGGTERILIVDDEEILINMAKVMLTQLGYEVTAFIDSTEALKTFENEPNSFDLVITDQTMPVLTGIELSKKLLKIRKDLPIILCTGYSKTVDEDKALHAGIKDFMMKPLRKRELAYKIRRVLNSIDSN